MYSFQTFTNKQGSEKPQMKKVIWHLLLSYHPSFSPLCQIATTGGLANLLEKLR